MSHRTMFRWLLFTHDTVMQYKVGSKSVTLSNKDLKGSGGEGSVYVKGSSAYKIYHDRNKMLPLGKIQELSAIQDPRVIRPLEVVSDAQGPVGYSMIATPQDACVLCQYFPRAFRTRFSLDSAFSNALVEEIRSGVENIHKAGVLLVDLNEMNFLFKTQSPNVFFIDVDSYQTPHHNATALMESVRDRHAKPNQFNLGTDWFAFAIVSFQIFTGIHPYKGKHPSLKTIDERMLANISVLNSSVNVPGACLPFDVIPANYRDWYERVLEKGERSEPPTCTTSPVVMLKTVSLAGGGKIRIIHVMQAQSDIADYYNGAYVFSGNVCDAHGIRKASNLVGEVRLFGTKTGTAAAYVKYGILHVVDLNTGNDIDSGIACNSMSVCDGKLVYQSGEYLYAADLMSAGNNILFTKKQIANVLPLGTQLYDGVAMQDLLEAKYATILSKDGTHQIKLAEISGHRVISAKCLGEVLVVIAESKGVYNRHVYRFDDTFQKYDHRVVDDVGIGEANFCVLDSGVTLLMCNDDTLEVLSSKIHSGSISTVNDPAINSNCNLFSVGSKAMYIYGNKVDQFTMS